MRNARTRDVAHAPEGGPRPPGRCRRPGPTPPRIALAFLGLLLGLLADPGAAVAAADPRPLPEYRSWVAACRKLPLNRDLGDRLAPRDLLPLQTYPEFAAALGPFLDQCRTGALARAEAWLEAPPPTDSFFDLDAAYYLRPEVPFQPFAQRLEVPPGTRVLVHGDLHGDIHSLITFLEAQNRAGNLAGFRVARPDVRLVFLGDYTDRGRHGVEVLYTLLRLALANPDQVFLVRGNHEDVSLVARYGFLAEAAGKYGRAFDTRRVARLYDFLPAVLYLAAGTNVVQCNHGGLEPGFRPDRLLGAPAGVSYQRIGRLEQRRLLVRHRDWVAALPPATRRPLEARLADFVPTSPTTPTVLGFLWNDFTAVLGEPQFAVDPGRAFVYGNELTRLVLDSARSPDSDVRVRAVLRGHQHAAELNPVMSRLLASRGIFRHWQAADSPAQLAARPDTLRRSLESEPERAIPDGSVWTFNVSPDSVYGAGCGFTYDTAGEVTTAARWEDWRLRVLNYPVVSAP
jgi:hypothetical protein